MPGPSRDIGQQNSDETKILMNLTLFFLILICLDSGQTVFHLEASTGG